MNDLAKQLETVEEYTNNPPRVTERLAGTRAVTTTDMQRHLGKHAFHLWVTSLHCRHNKNGKLYDHINNGWFVEALRTKYTNMVKHNGRYAESNPVVRDWRKSKKLPDVTLAQVKKAITRLRKCGLIINGKNRKDKVVRTELGIEVHSNLERHIIGDYRNGQCVVPAEVAARIMTLPTRGGRRLGAGAPKKVESNGDPVKTETPMITSTHKIGQESNGDPSKSNRTLSLSEREPQVERCASSFFDAEASTSSEKDPLLAIPPYPSTSRFKLAATPPPPQISEEADDFWCALACARAYRGATERRAKKSVWGFTTAKLADAKYYQNLIDSGKLLREHGLAPSAWAGWACDFWAQYIGAEGAKRPRGKIPPITFVFNPDFIKEKRGMFQAQMRGYLGGRTHYPAQYKEILRRYAGMNIAFRIRDPQTYEDYARIVEEHFPGGWEYHYDLVNQQAEMDRDRMQKLLQQGTYLWA